MRISKIEQGYLAFDDGSYISSEWCPECCENNYADFTAIDDLAKAIDFSEDLIFETAEYGFRFGDNPLNMVFVPCYSEQNGYYTPNVNIYYNDKLVLKGVEGEIID